MINHDDNGVSQDRTHRIKQVRGRRYLPHAYIERHILFIVCLFVLGVVAFFGVRTYHNAAGMFDKAYESAHFDKARNASTLLKKGRPFSILLLGTDTGELGRKYKGRTDSLMLVTINPKQHESRIVSIPRDTIIAPVGYEEAFPQKLNNAYNLGSAKTTMATIQTWLNVPVDYYALVNMGGIERIVNQLGGIEVKSPLTFKYNPDTAHEDPGNLYQFKKGSAQFTHTGQDGITKTYHRMDGKAALAFSRMRYSDPEGDYGRQQRQRLVLQGIVHEAVTSPLTVTSQSFLSIVGQSMKTDMTFSDLKQLGGNYVAAAKTIKTDHFIGKSYDLPIGSSEFISTAQKQRVTDELRKALDLPAKSTGPIYGGYVSEYQANQYGLPYTRLKY
ncbi:LCP family protein [Weissella halotolerans]|nr:LCP family protein [Weissella halotolerans]